MARRWHEARCSSRSTPSACEATATPEETAPPETATGRDLLPHVDRHVDMNNLSLEAMVQTLFISRDDLVELHSVNLELCREILSYVVVTWRPGAESGAPLRPALGLGPGRDEGTVVVRAKLPAFKAMMKQTVALQCLDNQLIKSAAAGRTPTRGRGCEPWGWLNEPSRPRCPRHLTGVSPDKFREN